MKNLIFFLSLFLTSCQTDTIQDTYLQADLTVNYTHPVIGETSVTMPGVPIKSITLTEGVLKIVYGCGIDGSLTDAVFSGVNVKSYFLTNKIEKVCP
jgi:hypothetical protein